MQTSIFSRLMVLLVLLFTTHLVWADADKEAEWEKNYGEILELYRNGYYNNGLYRAKSLVDYSKINFKNKIHLANSYNLVGLFLEKQDNLEESKKFYQESISIASRLNDTSSEIAYKSNLGNIYYKLGNIKKAENIFLNIYSFRKSEKEVDIDYLLKSINTLAVFYSEQDNFLESFQYYQKARDVLSNNPQEKNNYAYIYYNIGLTYQKLGKSLKAIDYLLESAALAREKFGDQHIEVAKVYYALADNHIETNQHTLAKPLYENALAIREQVFGTQHELVADCILGLADVHRATGSAKQAHSLYRKAVRIYKRSLGNSSAPMAVALNSWGVLYSQENNFEQAVALQTQALAMHQQHSDDQDYTSIIALNLGKAQTETQDFEQAEINLNKALTLRQQLKQSNRQIKPVNDALAALYQVSNTQTKAKARQ